ncbi:TPA: helix-turn-helix transcriptional regulator [Vibrio parahaemolyticus]|uniref:helix-turn-helix domain-containing protein n=1 Tax=Vibrio TaxID=662 RepID=UPI0013732229|nr:helix-turn-helix transcriptional regulator [Vibrio alginolyticus]EJR0948793.1 helix-turn-helix transcriptional regulator [Vibrio alginolyticus]MBY8318028.1 helix-turn-helix domain-containing protein [Vibrio fluvialis]NAW82323.1 helix-turn-helix domain-containing protein [Vibrio sp. V43_P6S15P86]NOH90376.1 helix-turn-helix transcriptional regulator [Vibrio alginolyticus]
MNKIEKNITGHQIRNIRVSKQLSQQDVERLCSLKGIDMTRSKLAKVESGMVRVTDEMLKNLADVLDVGVEEFFY